MVITPRFWRQQSRLGTGSVRMVRAGLIWRWAGKLQSFRANEDEDRRHKFSAVGREPFLHAYNKEPPMDTVTWKSMGYLDDNGHNTIMPLLKL